MSLRHNLLTIFIVIFNLSPLFTLAQGQDSLSLDQLLEMPLNQLAALEVVTASKSFRLSSEITQKVDVITRKQIRQTVSGNRNIAELIQYLPGASVKVLSRNYPNWGAYGGIGPKYSTYMVQGLPVDAFMDPMNIEVFAIQKIEIQRGPASVLYPNYLSQDFAGNQSPLAGTVNLIFKEQVSGPATRVSLGYGSYNTYTGQAYHENAFQRGNFLGGISFEASDYANYGTPGGWLNMQKKPEYRKGKVFMGANLELDKAKKHNIALFGNQAFHWGDEGRPYRGYDHDYGLLNAGYGGQLKNNLKISFKSGLRRYHRVWQGDNQDYALEYTKGVDQVIIPIDLSLALNHFQNSLLTLGVDYQYANYSTWNRPVGGNKTTGNDADISQIGIYVQEEFQFGNAVVRAGARFNYSGYDIDKSGGLWSTTEDWNTLLWSAGVKYRLTEEFTFYANGGSSFLSPSLKSLSGTLPLSQKGMPGNNGQLPNPDLDPENGIGLDLGLDYTLPVNVNFSVRTFFTKLTNAIIDNVISLNPSQTMSINTEGETVAKGFEFGIKQNIKKKIDWFANTTFTHSRIVNPDIPGQDRSEVPFVPQSMSNIGATFYLPSQIEICPWIHFGGRFYDSNVKSNRRSYESDELLNLNVLKRFGLPGNKSLDFFIRAYNLTDNQFDMPWDFKDPGFSFTVGSQIMF